MNAMFGKGAILPHGVDLQTIQQDLTRLTNAIQSLISGHDAQPGVEILQAVIAPADEAGEKDLASLARQLQKESAARDAVLPIDVFSDPAWHILLDLFAAEMEGKRISISSACIASGAPSTTALRYITMLVRRGAIERSKDQRDGRRHHVKLTQACKDRMARHLRMLAASRASILTETRARSGAAR